VLRGSNTPFPIDKYGIGLEIYKDMMFNNKTNEEIYASILAEAAKAASELKCARGDLNQADVRLKFILAAINHLQQRFEE
jgi:hypothetical protein